MGDAALANGAGQLFKFVGKAACSNAIQLELKVGDWALAGILT